MKRRILVALLVFVFAVPGVAVAEEPVEGDSIWQAVVAWFDGLVAEVIGDGAQKDDSEDDDLPSLWGTTDPVG